MNKRFFALLLCALLVLPTFAACGTNPPADISDGTSTSAATTSSTTVSSTSTTVSTDATSSFVTTTATKAPTKLTAKTTTTAIKPTTTGATATKPTEQPITDTLDLAVDGKSAYVIIRGKNCTRSERNAASELQDYIQKITGCSIPVKTDDIAPTACEIVVGKTNREKSGDFNRDELGTDGFIIKTADKKLYLVGGGDRGTLYAVYEFLESYLGCRFYTVGVEKVPQTDTIALNPIKEDKQIPVFTYRELYWSEYSASQDVAVKRKLSGHAISDGWGGGITYVDYFRVHTLPDFVKPATYYREHPEYYRINEAGQRDTSQLCLSNPDVLQIVIDEVRTYLRDNPDAEMISVSQEDNTPGNCYCDKCRAVDEAEGSYAGTLLRFVNEVARAVKDEFPNVYIHTLAYQYTRGVPLYVKPEDNVVVQLCSIECCFSHPLDAGCGHANNDFCNDLKNWAAICDNLYIWNYTTNFAHYNATFPNFSTLRQNIRLFAEYGADGVFEEGACQTINGEFSELRSYLLSKCMWNPYMTEEEFNTYMNDFLEGVYGDGWRYIREYIDLAEKEGDNIHFGCFASVESLFPTTINRNDNRALPTNLTLDMVLNYQTTDWEPFIDWYTDVVAHPLTARGEELFAKALAAAKTDKQKNLLDRVSIQAAYIASSYYYKLYCVNVRENVERLITAYLSANPNGFTAAQIREHAATAAAAVEQQYKDKYLAYNNALWARMLNYRMIVYGGGSNYLQQMSPNLSLPPDNWF